MPTVNRQAATCQPLKEDWHIGVFSMVLDTLVAFGPPDAAREAATAEEDWYRSTDVVAEEAYFADVRGRKSWLTGDDTYLPVRFLAPGLLRD